MFTMLKWRLLFTYIRIILSREVVCSARKTAFDIHFDRLIVATSTNQSTKHIEYKMILGALI